MAESLKEIAVGAEYKSDLFNVVAGVRFDGDDGMNKFDTYTYLKDYYGDWGYVGGPSQNAHLIGQYIEDKGYGMDHPQVGFIPIIYDTRAPHWKHIDEVYGKEVWGDGASISFGTANKDKPFDGSTRAIFGFNFKGVKNLTAKMQASAWNIGDFDRFGTVSIDETIGYAITPKFGASINFYQDFYGGDAFPDNMVNSPYFRFEPVVSYQLTRNIGSSLLFTYGVAKDVIESDWRLKPGFTFTLGGFGSFRGELYYELNAITYTDEAVTSGKGNFIPTMMQTEGGKAIYKHTIGLSVMWMF
jgi:hypothetical protein